MRTSNDRRTSPRAAAVPQGLARADGENDLTSQSSPAEMTRELFAPWSTNSEEASGVLYARKQGVEARQLPNEHGVSKIADVTRVLLKDGS